jgi:tetratricopeptide (TPR) repeat protein
MKKLKWLVLFSFASVVLLILLLFLYGQLESYKRERAYHRGLKYASKQYWDDALQQFDLALDDASFHQEIRFGYAKGRVLEALGKPADACQYYNSLLPGPEGYILENRYIICLFRIGKWRQAYYESNYKFYSMLTVGNHLSFYPKPAILSKQALELESKGKFRDALPLYDKMLALHLSLSDPDQTLMEIDPSLYYSYSAEGFVRKYYALRQLHRDDEALILFLRFKTQYQLNVVGKDIQTGYFD